MLPPVTTSTIADTGFFAVIDLLQPLKPVTMIGYRPGAKITPPLGRVTVQPLPQLIWPNGDSNQPAIRTAFEAFMQTLYGSGASLTSESVTHQLDEEMRAAGSTVTAQYARVQVVDFMAFCGAISRQQTLPDGTQVDCLALGPGDERPLMRDLERKDNNLMFSIITHLGIQGMLPYLYAGDAITFKDFCDQLRIWKPDPVARSLYVFGELVSLLRLAKSPVLSEAQILELVKD